MASPSVGQHFYVGDHTGFAPGVVPPALPGVPGTQAPLAQHVQQGQVFMCVGLMQGYAVSPAYGDHGPIMVPVFNGTVSSPLHAQHMTASNGMDWSPPSSRSPPLVLLPIQPNVWEEQGSGLRTPSESPRMFSPSPQRLFSDGYPSMDSRSVSPINTPPPDDTFDAQATDGLDLDNLTDEEFETLLTRIDGMSSRDRRCAVFELQARGFVWRMASSPVGSRILQEVLKESGDSLSTAQLAAGLKGHVNEAWESLAAAPHANHVLQKCIEVLPPEHCHFVLDEMLEGNIERASCSKYGCRIVQRLIEHFPAQQVKPLVRELLVVETVLKLMVSRFGNFVVQCVLEHGSERQRTMVASAFYEQDDAKFTRMAENMYASHVVQQAMKHCRQEVQRSIIERIMRLENADPRFKRSVYGSFVVHEAKKRVKADAALRTAIIASLPRASRRAGRSGRGHSGQDSTGGGLPQRRWASGQDTSALTTRPGATRGRATTGRLVMGGRGTVGAEA